MEDSVQNNPEPVVIPKKSSSGIPKLALALPLVVVFVLIFCGIVIYYSVSRPTPAINNQATVTPTQNPGLIKAQNSLKDFTSRVLRPPLVPTNYKGLGAIDDGSAGTVKYGTSDGIKINNFIVYPVYTQSKEGVYFRETVSLPGFGFSSSDAASLVPIYNKYFNETSPKGDIADWKLINVTSGVSTYERTFDNPNGSFDSQLIQVYPGSSPDKFNVWFSFCNTSPANPSFSKHSCS